MDTTTKSVATSKTLWFNVLSLLVVMLTTISGQEGIPAEYIPYFVMAVNIINVVLRFLTDKPVTFKKES